jgi:hypothetical protein
MREQDVRASKNNPGGVTDISPGQEKWHEATFLALGKHRPPFTPPLRGFAVGNPAHRRKGRLSLE